MTFDLPTISRDYQRDGVVRIRQFFDKEDVSFIRTEIARYIREDLPGKPADARTLEADEQTIRNLWRLELHNPVLRTLAEREEIRSLVRTLVHGEPVLAGIETFNKPARVGSAVPYHQDNAYFCQTPPDMLTIWIAIDPVTIDNGPIYFVPGSHTHGVLPTRPSGVRGNSIGIDEPAAVPLAEQFCALLDPGDATIHHANTVHHSEPNRTDRARLGLLFVFRGSHTVTDPALQATYARAVAMTPPA